MNQERSIVIGEIGGTFRLKGEVKILPHTDFPERFEDLEEIYIEGDKIPGRLLRLDSIWYHNKYIIAKLEGIDDVSAAESLRGARILISHDELMPLEEDEYYVHDILEMEVVTTDGESLGRVTEVRRTPANDIYVTERAMIPAIREFVETIDLNERKIVVRSAEGLIQE